MTTCQHILRSGQRVGQPCADTCMLDTNLVRTQYCSKHYSWNILHPEPVQVAAKSQQSRRPTYKVLILEAIEESDPESKGKTSPAAIIKHFQTHGVYCERSKLTRTLNKLVEEGILIKIAASYRRKELAKNATEVEMWLS